jgi:NADPH-dependent 2,4-dienoyl-CoA reductase/sulfur reductase-like enzyme
VPRVPQIPGIDHPKVASYVDIVEGRKAAGRTVAIIGAGGIGFDVAELLTAEHAPDGHASDGDVANPAIEAFREEWGIDASFASRGGLMQPHEHAGERKVWLLQRKESKVGAGLAKTTGWIRRALLKHRGVVMMAGVEYLRIDDEGLHVSVDGLPQVLAVDTIVICAGQEPRRDLVPRWWRAASRTSSSAAPTWRSSSTRSARSRRERKLPWSLTFTTRRRHHVRTCAAISNTMRRFSRRRSSAQVRSRLQR